MIGLDTNVLVRYLVEDDARQTAQAAALIERAIADDESLYVSDVVVCETVWVLSVAYKVGRKKIAAVLRNLFRAPSRLRGRDQLIRALDSYESQARVTLPTISSASTRAPLIVRV